MVLRPNQPLGKVPLILNDVFKLSKVLGSFPINSEFSGIAKFNVAKGLVLNLLAVAYAIHLSNVIWQREMPLGNKIAFSVQIVLQASFNFINLSTLVANSLLLKELYEELKDVEYDLWKNGVDWFYKASWYTKYFGFVSAIIYLVIWEIVHDFFKYILFNLIHFMTVPTAFSIMSQYMALLQICLTLIRDIRQLEDTRAMVKLYEKVLTVCRKVNTIYEQQIFLYIVSIFFIYIFTIYREVHHPMVLQKNVIWHIFRLFLFLHPLFPILRCIGCISEE
ncbi:Gustatory receptor 116a, partial [Halyomorpha halys]